MSFSYKKNKEPNATDYAGKVKEAEAVYGDKLSPEMFNLGETLSRIKTSREFNPKVWVAWMRGAEIKESGNQVYIRNSSHDAEWWMKKIHVEFGDILSQHYRKRIVYTVGGKVASFSETVRRYEDLTPEEKSYAESCFAEAKANIKAFVEKSKAAFSEKESA